MGPHNNTPSSPIHVVEMPSPTRMDTPHLILEEDDHSNMEILNGVLDIINRLNRLDTPGYNEASAVCDIEASMIELWNVLFEENQNEEWRLQRAAAFMHVARLMTQLSLYGRQE